MNEKLSKTGEILSTPSGVNLDNILDSTEDILFTLDTNHKHTGIWGKWIKELHLGKEFFLGKTSIELFGEEVGKIHFDSICKALQGEYVVYEWQIVNENELLYYQTSLTPIYNSNSEVVGIIGIGRNQTKEKIAQEKLKETQEVLNTALKLNQIGYQQNLDDFIQTVIDECVRITNSKIGFFHFINDDNLTISLQTWSTSTISICDVPEKNYHYPISEAGIWVDSFHQKKPIIHNDYKNEPNKKGLPIGHTDLIRDLVVPVVDEGNVVVLFGVGNKATDYKQEDIDNLILLAETMWNIIKRKKIELEIKESENKYRNLVENAFDAIYLLNGRKLEFVNQAFCNLFGYTFLELIDNDFNIFNLFDKNTQSVIEERLGKREQNISVTNRFIVEVITKQGLKIHTEVISSPIQINGEQKILGIIRDVEERIKYEKKLIEAKNEANEHIRLKSSFLSNISHELRTPLNGILGFSELIIEKECDEDNMEMMNCIKVSALRLKKSLDSLIDLSKLESGKQLIRKDLISLNHLLRIYTDKYKTITKAKGIELTFVEHCEKLIVNSDEKMLMSVIENILENAIKFTAAGGIEIGLFTNDSAEVHQAVISIKDSGIGIDDDKLKIIFDEFRQISEGLNRNYEGVGIGLTIAQKYIKLLGGSIEVISEIGKGSNFYIYLPMEKNTNKNELKQIKSKDSVIKKKILLVEDDHFAQNIVKRFLGNDFDLSIAGNDIEAMNLALSNVFDLILMDINLGLGKSGLEVAQDIKELSNYKNIPIIATTAFVMHNEKDKFLKEGCNDFLAKPYTKSELLAVIDKYLSRRS